MAEEASHCCRSRTCQQQSIDEGAAACGLAVLEMLVVLVLVTPKTPKPKPET